MYDHELRLFNEEIQEKVERIIAKDYDNPALSDEIALGSLWFVFGNNGPAHTPGNHKYIQRIVEGNDHLADLYDATEQCKDAVRRVTDYR